MAAEERNQAPDTFRRALVIVAAGAAVVVASFVYLRPQLSGAAHTARATLASPSPSQIQGQTSIPISGIPPSCPTTELKLTGAFTECAAVDRSLACSKGSWIFVMHGTAHDFLIYVEFDGAYHGPATYALLPWPHSQLNDADGVVKVAVREYASGRLWESSAGSLTIDNLENSGWLYAGLGASPNSPVQVDLNVAGWWSCS